MCNFLRIFINLNKFRQRVNGYYLSKVFDTNSGPEIYDNEVTRRGQPHYYKYNHEYSVISR